MKKYIVKIAAPEYRAGLAEKFEKVGSPEALADFLIVETDKPIESIRACEGVELVEESQLEPPVFAVNQQSPENWALSFISNSGGSYQNEKTGKGVDIYLIDSGVRETHQDLVGRVEHLWSYDDVNYAVIGGVANGHGTGVAGCAIGTKYGTAKEANIVSCRTNFYGNTNLKCIDKVLRHHLDKPDNRPSILNVSMASNSPITTLMYERLTEYGIVVIAASGNSAGATPMHPAASPHIVSVGALNQAGEIAAFSNRGADIYAPGDNIITASVFGNTTPITSSGTSFAAPLYCGLMACQLEGSDKFNTQALVSAFNAQMLALVSSNSKATSKSFGGVYYTAPSKLFTDEQIEEHFTENAANPQYIADICRDFNLSLSRLSKLSGFSSEEINQYFGSNKPWWV